MGLIYLAGVVTGLLLPVFARSLLGRKLAEALRSDHGS
jgi:hypothetical protein